MLERGLVVGHVIMWLWKKACWAHEWAVVTRAGLCHGMPCGFGVQSRTFACLPGTAICCGGCQRKDTVVGQAVSFWRLSHVR